MFIRSSLSSLVAVVLLAPAISQAQQPGDITTYSVAELVARYPAGSIQSSEKAEAAVKEVGEARIKIQERVAAEQQACYPKFFTTSCLNKVTERRRLDLAAIKPIELEGNSYIRHARVADRDRKLEENARDREAKNGTRSVPVPQINDAPRNEGVSEEQRKARAAEYARKNAEHAQRERERAAAAEEDAEKRARNVERYEEKVKESEARQKEVEQRKAERKAQQAN